MIVSHMYGKNHVRLPASFMNDFKIRYIGAREYLRVLNLVAERSLVYRPKAKRLLPESERSQLELEFTIWTSNINKIML
jgi:hypothetical protein